MMMQYESNTDIAGKDYWNKSWDGAGIPKIINPNDKSIRCVAEQALNEIFHKIFNMFLHETRGRRFLEVGCGNSAFMPYMNKEFGFRVSGLDYSESGCETARKASAYYGVETEVILCDMFNPPSNLLENFDVVFAGGVIEHFTETYQPCEAMVAMTKTRGCVINMIPNFSTGSIMGKLQKKYASDIFDKHVLLDKEALIYAHEKAGLETLYCEYILPHNYYVLNFDGRFELLRKCFVAKGLLSMLCKKDKIAGTKANASHIVYVGRKC